MNSSIHHVTRANPMGASLGIAQSNLRQSFHGAVIAYCLSVPGYVFEDSAVPMIGIFTQTNVYKNHHFRKSIPNLSNCDNHRVVIFVCLRPRVHESTYQRAALYLIPTACTGFMPVYFTGRYALTVSLYLAVSLCTRE